MEIVNSKIEEYLLSCISARNAVLQEMEEYAYKRSFPIVGPLVGQFLEQYTKIIQAKRIFELGSGFGYSATWFAKGNPNAEIYCTDGDNENAKRAKSYFERLGITNQINFLVGDAVTHLNKTGGEFDIIYNDIDKQGYPEAFDAAIPRLRKGGLLITDNTLWYGRILEKGKKSDATKGIEEFNRKAFSDSRIQSMIIPIRDGVCVSLKL